MSLRSGSAASLPKTGTKPRAWKEWALRFNRPRRDDAGKVLRCVHDELSQVSGAAEEIFLRLGERLMDLQVRARNITGQAASLAELLSSDAGSLSALDQLLASVCTDHEDNISMPLKEIGEGAKSVHQAIHDLGPVVKTFDVLGVLTRVESARFEGAEAAFAGLADAVSELSRQIRDRTATATESASILVETTSLAAEQMRSLAQQRQEVLGPLTRQTTAELAQIEQHRDRVADATKQLGVRFDGISRALGDVVTALQAHDIVRQQIEHVLEALSRLQSSPDGNRARAIRLQSAQLNHSRMTFENSVRQIGDALERVGCNIHELASDSAGMLADSGGGASSQGTESGLSGILSLLERNATAELRLAQAALAIDGRVSGMAQPVDGVLTIGIEMQRIAMNATIQAAHLGREGGALEIVAQSIQTLARETETASRALGGRLQTVRSAASALGTSTERRGGSDERMTLLRRSAQTLDSIREEARAGHAGIVERIGELDREIRLAIEGFVTHDRSLAMLAAAAASLEELASSEPSSGASSEVDMASNYTMESERVVEQALREAANGRSVEAPASQPADAAEENVEFF